MESNRKVYCAGCSCQYPVFETKFHRNKRWCGDQKCFDVINDKVKHANYVKQQKKIKKGIFRSGVPQPLRELIKARDNDTCKMCHIVNEPYGMQVHHIIPVSDGGDDSENNLILLCYKCHVEVHRNDWRNYINKFQSYTCYLG